MVQLTSNIEHDEETPLLGCNSNPNTHEEPKSTPLPKKQIAIVLLAQLCEPVTSLCIYPFVNQLVSELDITGGDERKVGYYAGLIESLFFVTEAFTVLQWGRASDHVGRKPIILIGLFGLCISMLAFGLSRTFWMLVVSRCLAGILNGNVGVMKSMMGELTDETNMARGFSLMPIVWASGSTIGPFLGGALSHPYERLPALFKTPFWKAYPYFLPCAAAAAISALSFCIAAVFLKETLQKPRKPSREREGAPQFSTDVTHKSEEAVPLRDLLVFPVLITILNYVFLAILSIMVSALQPLFYSTPISYGGLGMTPALIGNWLAAVGFLDGLFQVLLFAPIVQRWGARCIFITGMVFFLPALALFPVISFFARSQGVSLLVWALLGLQAVCQVFWDMSYGCVFMLITSASPNKRSLGAVNGLSQTTVSIARAVGPFLATSSFAFSLEYNILGGNAVYLLLILISCTSLFAAAKLP